MRFAAPTLVALSLLASVFAPGRAEASGGGAQAVEEGRRLALEARFDEALAAFDRAAGSTDLTPSDVVALLEGRAIVHHGQRDDEAFAATAQGLASIAPDYEPSRRIPPRLARRLREAIQGASPLTLEASGERSREGVVVTSRVDDDPASLVARVVVSARVGNGAYVDHEGMRVALSAGPTEGVRYHVRAIGPGGAVLASVGSAESPEVMPVEELPPPAVTATHADDGRGADATSTSAAPSDDRELFEDAPPPEDEGLPLWPFVLGGVVVAAALAAIIVALVVIPGDDTSPSIPGHPL